MMLHGRFDMHTHSTASDGSLSPAELVKKAYELGLGGLAITDHDTLAGLAEAGEAVALLNMQLIAGVELSCELPQGDMPPIEVHILGYFLEKAGDELNDKLAEMQQHRLKRGEEILRRLAALGMELPDLAAAYREGGSLGRGLIGRALVEAGYAADTDEAFAKWLSVGCAAYVPRLKLLAADGINLLHRNGAVAFLAHPIQLQNDEVIPYLASLGIDGMEVSHPDHSPQDEQRYREMATKLGLAVSGGSDYHSEKSKGGLASHTATAAELQQLWQRYEKYRQK